MRHIYYSMLAAVLLAVGSGSASAQRMPERSAVRSGNRQFHKGNYDRSIERYEQALRFAPESFEALYDLGNGLYEAEQYEQAEQTMLKAAADTLRTETERAEAFYNLGNAQFKQQKYQEALASYRQSLRLNPSDVEAKYNYAYTKRLLDEQQNGGGGGDSDQNQENDQNQDQQQSDGSEGQQNQQQDGQQERSDDEQQDDPQQGDEERQQGRPQAVPAGISEQEQQQMLDAIQAQEDRTQEKLKEKQGVVVRGKKNW